MSTKKKAAEKKKSAPKKHGQGKKSPGKKNPGNQVTDGTIESQDGETVPCATNETE